mmetsp:Transcript_22721/g.42660  ORF Transcript_22721/g.42660 Transcript_22721/m.42660 type:complete len:330 (-) Transcript_22721:283-1272(-)
MQPGSHHLAAACVAFAVVITLCQIRMQIIWNSNSAMRKHVVRILMMVPIYALQCFLGLVVENSSVYFDSLRECYEAVVIYSFVGLIIGYLGEERHLIYIMELKPQEFVNHHCPASLCLGSRVRLGNDFYRFAKLGALQYVVVKPITAALALVLEAAGVYGEDTPFRLDKGYLYLVVINSFSQALAIYSLIMFYTVMRQELLELSFLPKAVVLKAVIFFTYWQGICFRLLYSVDLFPIELENDGNGDAMARFLDFLLCLEMAGFAILQWLAWGKGDEFFDPNATVSEPYGASVLAAANLKDLWEDAKEAVETGEARKLLGNHGNAAAMEL